MRRFVAALLTVVGAAGLVIATIRPWQDVRGAVDLSLPALFGGVEPVEPPGFLGSLAVPLIVATMLAVLGMLVRSKMFLGLGFLIDLVLVAGWAWRLAGDEGARAASGSGFFNAAGAAVALLLATFLLPSRKPAVHNTPAKPARPKGRFGPQSPKPD